MARHDAVANHQRKDVDQNNRHTEHNFLYILKAIPTEFLEEQRRNRKQKHCFYDLEDNVQEDNRSLLFAEED